MAQNKASKHDLNLLPLEIFCSYAHEDEPLRQQLEKHLSLLSRQGIATLWHNRRITPGVDWSQEIDIHLETASLLLLLISSDFLASDYCYGVEMRRALQRHGMKEAHVLPILVRPCAWQDAPFASLQVLPKGAKPVTKWRDRDTAWTEVVAGIRQVLDERMQPAPSVSRFPEFQFWNIPFSRNPFFGGRDELLKQLYIRLHTEQMTAHCQPQAISGLGGVGKTQLAIEYAYRYHQEYQFVLWAQAESLETLTSSYVALATLLQLPERSAEKHEIIVRAVINWLQTHHNWLLILDNADEPDLLLSFVPYAPTGHLLITTRAADLSSFGLGVGHALAVQALDPVRGALLLLQRAGLIPAHASLDSVSPRDRMIAQTLSQELGGLPLALDQAGAYLAATHIDLQTYLHMFQQHRARLLTERRGREHPRPVVTTWSLAFQRVAEKNPAALDILRLCAHLSPDAIPEAIFTQGSLHLGPTLSRVSTDALQFNQAIEALRTYSLVQRDPQGRTLTIHRLVQAVLQDEMEEDERSCWIERALLAVNAAFSTIEIDRWPQCELFLPHALAVIENIERHHLKHRETEHLLYTTASYLQVRARYIEAEGIYEKLLNMLEQQLGPEHPHVTSPLHRLADLYHQQGKLVEAEQLYKRALSILVETDHPQVAYSINGLANLYHQQGKLVEAEQLYKRALRIWEQQFGPENSHAAHSLSGLANLYHQQEKLGEAEQLYKQALHIWEQQFGPEYPDIAQPLNGLANLYQGQEKCTEAESLYKRALNILEQHLGPDHPDIAYSLNGLANLYHQQGKLEEAEALHKRALNLVEQQLGSEHSHIALSLHGLANLYCQQAKFAEAESLYKQALHILEQQFGPEYPQIARLLNSLANFYFKQSKYIEAELLYERALHLTESQLGPKHPNAVYSLNGLANIYRTQGKKAEAERLEERVLRLPD